MEAALLAFSEHTGIQAFMYSHWGWPFTESLHFIGLSLLIGAVGIFDLRMMGFFRSIPLLALHRLVPFGIGGYLLNVTTGIMFVTSVPDQYIYNPAFQSKIMFMIVAGINVFFFYRFCFRELVSEPTPQTQIKARLFAAISLLCWLGVITAGRLITFYRPPYFWCFWCS
jgi:hypothetical protein